MEMTSAFAADVVALGAVALGAVGAVAAQSRLRAVRAVPAIYVEAIRNTPLLVQIYIIYFGLPAIGLRLTPPVAAVLALGFNAGAYASEILRAGIEAVPRGQIEAGWALGLSRLRTMRLVVARQVLAAMFPALVSQFVLIMLASSLVSAISVADLTATANNIQGMTFRSFEAFLVVAAIYFGLTFVMRTGLTALERVMCRYKFVGR